MTLNIPAACDDRQPIYPLYPVPPSEYSPRSAPRVSESIAREAMAAGTRLAGHLNDLAVQAKDRGDPASAHHCMQLAGHVAHTVLDAVQEWPT